MMARKPDEIKKGLECLTKDNAPDAECEGCPYFEELGYLHWSCHRGKIWADTFILIQQLQAENTEKDQRIRQLEAERDAAVKCIGVLTVILKKYPYAATNGCAYEAYMEIKKYIEAVRGVQKEK